MVDINDMYRRKSDQIQTIMEGKLQMILKEVFNYLHEKLLEYVLKNNFQIEYENTHINFTAFHLIIDLIEILIVSSKEFATTFHMVKKDYLKKFHWDTGTSIWILDITFFKFFSRDR